MIHYIFDARCVQKLDAEQNPLERFFESMLMGFIETISNEGKVSIYINPEHKTPASLVKYQDIVIRHVPRIYATTVVLDVKGGDELLISKLPLAVRNELTRITFDGLKFTRSITKSTAQDDCHYLTYSVKTKTSLTQSQSLISPSLHHAWEKALTPFEQAELDTVLADGSSIIVVDGKICEDIDLMRSLVGLRRQMDLTIIALSPSFSQKNEGVKYVRPKPSLVKYLIERSIAVFIPKSEGSVSIAALEADALKCKVIEVDKELGITNAAQIKINAGPLSTNSESKVNGNVIRDIIHQLPEKSGPAVPGKPKIAFVTPMFPQLGGPARTSLNVALELSKISTLDVWTDADMLPSHRSKVNGVFNLDAEINPEKYDEIVYVIGNHPMYAKIFNMHRRTGGTLILHDAHMIDFVNFTYGKARAEKYFFDEYKKRVSLDDVGKLISTLSEYKTPFLKSIIKYADTLIVHSPTSASLIDKIYGTNVKYLPISMSYYLTEQDLSVESRNQAKVAAGLSPTRPCIVSFGEVNLLKGAKQCIYTAKELHEWGVEFQLVFVGPIDESLNNELTSRIESYGLSDYVSFTGAVSEAIYVQYLKAADINLQIRQIPFGQVSGALLDAVSAGMHGVASENLAKSIEAPPYIHRINDKGSPTLYADKIKSIIDSKQYLERPGKGWDEYVNKHSAKSYAHKLISTLFSKF